MGFYIQAVRAQACRALSAMLLLLSGLLVVPDRRLVCTQSSSANGPAVFRRGLGHRPGQGRSLTPTMPGRCPSHTKGVIPSHIVSIFKLKTRLYFPDQTVFFRPDFSPNYLDHVVQLFPTVSKKGYSPD